MTKFRDHNIPYNQRPLAVFTYKVLLYLCIGATVGFFFAMEFISVWFLIVFIPAVIGVGWLFVMAFIKYTDRQAQDVDSQQVDQMKDPAPALIDGADFAGVKLLEKRELIILRITVFPTNASPFSTSIRQFMTAEQIALLKERDVVSFYENANEPGYGLVSLREPTAPILVDKATYKASKTYPPKGKVSALHLIGRRSNIFSRIVNILLILTIFGFGFLTPYMVTGNVDWLRLKIIYFPQKLIFQHKGNYNPEAFVMAYEKAMSYIGDQQIEAILFYKDYTNVQIQFADNPRKITHVTIRGNSVQDGFLSLATATQPGRLFPANSVSLEVLQKVLEDVATDHDLADISYLGIRSDFSWRNRPSSHPSGERAYYVDIHVLLDWGEESLHYSSKTGERILSR